MKYKIPYIARTNHSINQRVVKAFAQGCGGEMFNIYESDFSPERVATYGVLRGTTEIIKSSKEYWYIDRGYFQSREYFRITKNNLIHSGLGEHGWNRFSKFKKRLKPWRLTGKNIVVVPPSKPMATFLESEDWMTDTLKEVMEYTDRDILISRKPGGLVEFDYSPLESSAQIKDTEVPLEEALKDAWVLVTNNSNAMVDAVIDGVPIICNNNNRKINSIKRIESPIRDREFLKNLAYNQWTLEEMRSGKAWAELNEWG